MDLKKLAALLTLFGFQITSIPTSFAEENWPQISQVSISTNSIKAGEDFIVSVKFNGNGLPVYGARATLNAVASKEAPFQSTPELKCDYHFFDQPQGKRLIKSGTINILCKSTRVSFTGQWIMRELSLTTTSCDLTLSQGYGNLQNLCSIDKPGDFLTLIISAGDYDWDARRLIPDTNKTIFDAYYSNTSQQDNQWKKLPSIFMSSPGTLSAPKLTIGEISNYGFSVTYPIPTRDSYYADKSSAINGQGIPDVNCKATTSAGKVKEDYEDISPEYIDREREWVRKIVITQLSPGQKVNVEITCKSIDGLEAKASISQVISPIDFNNQQIQLNIIGTWIPRSNFKLQALVPANIPCKADLTIYSLKKKKYIWYAGTAGSFSNRILTLPLTFNLTTLKTYNPVHGQIEIKCGLDSKQPEYSYSNQLSYVDLKYFRVPPEISDFKTIGTTPTFSPPGDGSCNFMVGGKCLDSNPKPVAPRPGGGCNFMVGGICRG
jgi:hypothetical protein